MTTGIFHDVPAEEYHSSPGVSNSSLKDLIVSPLRFWHNHVNPAREQAEDDSTPAQIFGSALHSAVLDSEQEFDRKFCRAFDPELYPIKLDKADDLKEWIKANGATPKGTRKDGWIEQAQAFPNCPPIMVLEECKHFAQNEGKQFISPDDWTRLAGCAEALIREPEFQRLREGCKTEVTYCVKHPETGVLLRARMDAVSLKVTIDPKTFSSKGKTIDRARVLPPRSSGTQAHAG